MRSRENRSQLIGRWAEEAVESQLRFWFPSAALSRQWPDEGTDAFVRIDPHSSRFMPSEWRIQVKGTINSPLAKDGKKDYDLVELKATRAQEALSSLGNTWLLFFVAFSAKFEELACLSPAERAQSARYYCVDISQATAEWCELTGRSLFSASRIAVRVPRNNRINMNLATYLLAECLWGQIESNIVRLRGRNPLDPAVERLWGAIMKLQRGAASAISEAGSARSLIQNLNGVLKEQLEPALGILDAIEDHLVYVRGRHLFPSTVDSYVDATNLDDVVCWLCSPWYSSFIDYCLSMADTNQAWVTLQLPPQIMAARPWSVMYWQVIKYLVLSRINVRVRRGLAQDLWSADTIVTPTAYRTKIYSDPSSWGVADYPADPKKDDFSWMISDSNTLEVVSVWDAYSPALMDYLGLINLTSADLKGYGVPSNLLPLQEIRGQAYRQILSGNTTSSSSLT